MYRRPVLIDGRWHELSNQYLMHPPSPQKHQSRVCGINRWLRGSVLPGTRGDNGFTVIKCIFVDCRFQPFFALSWIDGLSCSRSLMMRRATTWTFSVSPDIMRTIWRRWSSLTDSSWTGKPINSCTKHCKYSLIYFCQVIWHTHSHCARITLVHYIVFVWQITVAHTLKGI